MKIDFVKTHVWFLAVGAWLAVCWNATAEAATRPPEMPASFDQATVQRLIDAIEQPPNAMLLKAGYFLRRSEQPLPVKEGFTLLQAAADKAAVGSKRWFVLQEILGIAAFRLAEDKANEGFAAYETLFSHASDAPKAGASYALRQAINDYVFSTLTILRDHNLLDDERTSKTMMKAWTAYARSLAQEAQSKNKIAVSEPLWSQALDQVGMDDEFKALVEKTLHDPTVPKTYGLYKAAATILQPARAVAVLREARPLLPTTDLTEVGWYFTKLVDLLMLAESQPTKPEKDKLAEAISAQQEMVKLTGRGQARLAELRRQAGDDKAFDELLASLNTSQAPEAEIIAVAVALNGAIHSAKTPNDKFGGQLVDLLSHYLAAPRERRVETELRARHMLGGALVEQHKLAAARTALKTDHLKIPPTSGRARAELRSIQRIIERIATLEKAQEAPFSQKETRR
jgi:hypothetical protein